MQPERTRIAAPGDGVCTVLLGADHLDERRFDAEAASEAEFKMLRDLEARIADGARIVLALGRYEGYGYKNSAAIFRIFEALQADGHALHLVVLAGQEQVRAPASLSDSVTFLGTISDAALQALMGLSALGVSTSRWEGFNLPLAEMQWLGKPALAFNVGAHPEVTAHPWLLADTEAELIRKAKALLRGEAPLQGSWAEHVERFRQGFKWRDVFERWTAFVVDSRRPPSRKSPRLVLMDVTNSARDPANSGVIRVTRRLGAELQKSLDVDVVFVVWDAERQDYRLLGPHHHGFLSSNAGPTDHFGVAAGGLGATSLQSVLGSIDPGGSSVPVVFLPEVILDGSAAARIAWAKGRGLASAAILYDMLPIFEAGLVDHAVASAFPPYAEALCGVDALWSISKFSLNEFERYNDLMGLANPSGSEAVWLPGQFSDLARDHRKAPADRLDILCVSTIEPRKNHRVFIEAFRKLLQQRPDLDVRLSLVGNSYAGSEQLADWLRQVTAEEHRIIWRGILPDSELADQYRRSAFTVYPSLAEGFGLPILESLWMDTPCLCHDRGVMAELAADGGCLTVDMSDVVQVMEGLDALLTNPELREALRRQARRRSIDTWGDYAAAIAGRLHSVGN